MLSPNGDTCAFSGTRLCGRSFTCGAGAGGCGAGSAFNKFASTAMKGCARGGGGCGGLGNVLGCGGLGNILGCGGACGGGNGGGGGGGGGGRLGINAFPRPCPTFWNSANC